MGRPWILGLALPAAGLLGGLGSCSEPVHDQEVEALGPEQGGVPAGEHHRAGQPCLVCHGALGPSEHRFSVAGTVFFGPSKAVGQEGVEVLMVDAANTSPPPIRTNCVGNFFVRFEQWNPRYPVLVRVARGDKEQSMISHVGREGSCAGCHRLGPPDFDSPGHVFLVSKAEEGSTPIPEPSFCPVSPTPRRGAP